MFGGAKAKIPTSASVYENDVEMREEWVNQDNDFLIAIGKV
jgi:hypothetical protein